MICLQTLYISMMKSIWFWFFSFMWTGVDWDHFGTEICGKPTFAKELCNCGGCFDLLIRGSIFLVMGGFRVADSQWGFLTTNTFSWPEHYSMCEPYVCVCDCTSIFNHVMSHAVWNLPVLLWMGVHYDSICLLLPPWDERCSNWGDEPLVALPLVLEKICSSPWGWEATTTHIMEWEETRCIYDRMCRFWTKLHVTEQSKAIRHQTDLSKFWWSRMALEHGDMKKMDLVMKQPNRTCNNLKLYMQSIVSPKHFLVGKLKVELLVYLYLIY